MKKLLFILTTVFIGSGMAIAEDVLVDVNFTRDASFWFKGATPANVSYTGEVFDGGYILTGQLSVLTEAQKRANIEDSNEMFLYAHRISRNVSNQIILPQLSDIGRVSIQAFNYNGANDAVIPIQYDANEGVGEPEWTDFEPAVGLFIPRSGDAPSAEIAVEASASVDVSSARLRLAPTTNPGGGDGVNIMVFTVKVEKMGPSTGLAKIENNFKFGMNGRNLNVITSDSFTADIYTITGVKVGQIANNQGFSFSAPGHYILRVSTENGDFAKKMIVF